MHAHQHKTQRGSFQTEIDGDFVLVTYDKHSWHGTPRSGQVGCHDDYEVDNVRVWTLDGDVELEPSKKVMAQIEREAYVNANLEDWDE